ncbi:MAG: hypothetical protein JWQ92_1047 [Amnibacterium sp.]|nr:hypothetical protein [Amnibacterium sp.]
MTLSAVAYLVLALAIGALMGRITVFPIGRSRSDRSAQKPPCAPNALPLAPSEPVGRS